MSNVSVFAFLFSLYTASIVNCNDKKLMTIILIIVANFPRFHSIDIKFCELLQFLADSSC